MPSPLGKVPSEGEADEVGKLSSESETEEGEGGSAVRLRQKRGSLVKSRHYQITAIQDISAKAFAPKIHTTKNPLSVS